MALNFPNSPTVGQIYTDVTSGFSYEWNGTVWRSYSAAASPSPNFDNINVTGITTTRRLQVTTNTNVVGIITATEYDINGSTNTLSAGGLNVGIATATTLRVGTAVTISSGVVTATSFVGSGAQLTGLNIPAGYNDLDNALFG